MAEKLDLPDGYPALLQSLKGGGHLSYARTAVTPGVQLGHFVLRCSWDRKRMMETVHVDPERRDSLEEALAAVRQVAGALLDEGAGVAITVADEGEELSPQEAATRLGFSRQHVRRLIDAGVLDAQRLPGSRRWKIPLRSVLLLEEQRAAARERADELSRELDRLGAPLE